MKVTVLLMLVVFIAAQLCLTNAATNKRKGKRQLPNRYYMPNRYMSRNMPAQQQVRNPFIQQQHNGNREYGNNRYGNNRGDMVHEQQYEQQYENNRRQGGISHKQQDEDYYTEDGNYTESFYLYPGEQAPSGNGGGNAGEPSGNGGGNAGEPSGPVAPPAPPAPPAPQGPSPDEGEGDGGNGDNTAGSVQVEIIRGRDGRDGQPGEPGEDRVGDPGPQGPQGDQGPQGEQGDQGEQGPPGKPGINGGGAVYTRWGRTVCPGDADLVYSGRVAGTPHNRHGGGANYLCLVEDAEYLSTTNPGSPSELYGSEYQSPVDKPQLHDHNVPCAICHLESRTSSITIPGKITCPDDTWTLEYKGYLMTGHHSHQHTYMFECVDLEIEAVSDTFQNTDGALWYNVGVECNRGIPCQPYINKRVVTCAVCSK